MKNKLITGSVIVFTLFMFLSNRHPGIMQKNDPFRGIDDDTVLPILQNLPRQHGGMNVPAEDGRFLYDFILEKGYKRGMEIGTSNGYSGLWIGQAI